MLINIKNMCDNFLLDDNDDNEHGPVLVLDLDGTLVSTKDRVEQGWSTDDGSVVPINTADFETLYVHIRPFAISFMIKMHKMGVRLVIWSAGTPLYVNAIVSSALWPKLAKLDVTFYISGVYTSTDLDLKGIKNLERVARNHVGGNDRSAVVLIDDSIEQCMANSANGFTSIKIIQFDSQALDSLADISFKELSENLCWLPKNK